MSKFNFRLFLSHFWQPLLLATAAVVVAASMLFASLGSSPGKLSANEVAAGRSTSSLREIWHDPVNAPFKVPEHFLVKYFPHSVFARRAVPAIFGAIALMLFFGILRYWQNSLVAAFGTVVFASSSWFLHTARLATPSILFFGVLSLFACALWLKHTLKREVTMIISAVIICSLLYVPGFVWFVLAGIILRRSSILRELKLTKNWAKIVTGLAVVVLLLPLVWAIVNQPSLAWSVLGLSSHVPSLTTLLKNLYNIPLALFIHAPLQPVSWLGHMPILNIFEDAMLVLGLYLLVRYRGLDRSQLIAGMSAVAIILITLGGPVTISLLIPLVYLTIAIGIAYMLDLWLTVFPSNPVARALGTLLIFIAVAVSCNYQVNRYFVAWTKAPSTQAVFTQTPN